MQQAAVDLTLFTSGVNGKRVACSEISNEEDQGNDFLVMKPCVYLQHVYVEQTQAGEL